MLEKALGLAGDASWKWLLGTGPHCNQDGWGPLQASWLLVSGLDCLPE